MFTDEVKAVRDRHRSPRMCDQLLEEAAKRGRSFEEKGPLLLETGGSRCMNLEMRCPNGPKSARSWLPRKFWSRTLVRRNVRQRGGTGGASGLVTSSELPLWGYSDAFTDPGERDEPVIMGIDEAGEGRCSPMVYGSAFCFLGTRRG